MGNGETGRLLQIDGNAALVAVDRRKDGTDAAFKRRPATCVVPFQRLDLNYFGTEPRLSPVVDTSSRSVGSDAPGR